MSNWRVWAWVAWAAFAAPASAEWFTLAGVEHNPDADYIQVDPTAMEFDEDKRRMPVRVSRGSETLSSDGLAHRSFSAIAEIDCRTGGAQYLSATWFAEPNFRGAVLAQRSFDGGDVRPMLLARIPGNPAERIVRAACRIKRAPAATTPAKGG